MADISKLEASVDALSTAAQSSHDTDTQVITLLGALTADIADLKAQLSPALQAAVDAMQLKVDQATGLMTTDKQSLADAMTKNPA